MKIVKYINGLGQSLDYYVIELSNKSYKLEWSGSTRDKSGFSPNLESLESALDYAHVHFKVSLDRWINGDPMDYNYIKDEKEKAEESPSSYTDIWDCFSWSTPQISQLSSVLDVELKQRINKYELEKELYPNDPDERSINRLWGVELSHVLRKWCALLELNPVDLPGYRKAFRKSVWNDDLIRTDNIASIVTKLLNEKSNGEELIFRPTCLEVAQQELMKWLQKNPKDIDRVHHRTFEAIISEIIKNSGWFTQLTKQTRDGGYDILCLQNNITDRPIKMIVETKLYDLKYSVGLPMVDRVMGVSTREHADFAMIVTNSRFTSIVWEQWEEHVGRDLNLIDRSELFEWLQSG